MDLQNLIPSLNHPSRHLQRVALVDQSQLLLEAAVGLLVQAPLLDASIPTVRSHGLAAVVDHQVIVVAVVAEDPRVREKVPKGMEIPLQNDLAFLGKTLTTWSSLISIG